MIAKPLISILRILVNTKLARLWKKKVEFNADSRNKLYNKDKFNSKSEICDSEVDGNEIRDNKITKKNNYQKIRKTFKSKKMVRFLNFFTFKTRLVFIKLRKPFVKAPIFIHFDLKYYIQIEMVALVYTISEVIS